MYLRARTDKKKLHITIFNYYILFIIYIYIIFIHIIYYLLQLPESKFNETKNVNKSKIKNK